MGVVPFLCGNSLFLLPLFWWNHCSEVVEEMGRGNPIHPSAAENWPSLWKQAFVCAGLGPWQTGHNQAIVCLGKASASYCNYLWKKIFDVFGRGWVWGGCGRMGKRLTSCAIHSRSLRVKGSRLCDSMCLAVWAEKFKTFPALVPGMREGMAWLCLRLIWGNLSCVWALWSPLTSWCFLYTFAYTLPLLWLESGPAMLIHN